MSLRDDAKRVGKYIRQLYKEVERYKETGELTGKLRNNREVADILECLPLKELIEITFTAFTLASVSADQVGDKAFAKLTRRRILNYANELQRVIEDYKEWVEWIERNNRLDQDKKWN